MEKNTAFRDTVPPRNVRHGYWLASSPKAGPPLPTLSSSSLQLAAIAPLVPVGVRVVTHQEVDMDHVDGVGCREGLQRPGQEAEKSGEECAVGQPHGCNPSAPRRQQPRPSSVAGAGGGGIGGKRQLTAAVAAMAEAHLLQCGRGHPP